MHAQWGKIFFDGEYKACPFGSGLRKFKLDPVVVIFFKKCQKNYKCQSDPVVFCFFVIHLIKHL